MQKITPTALVFTLLASFLPGCGESGPQAPTEADQQKVHTVSKELVTKYGYPTAKGPAKTPPGVRR